jgi:hypothetical protein
LWDLRFSLQYVFRWSSGLQRRIIFWFCAIRFRGRYCLHRQGCWWSIFLRNFSTQPKYYTKNMTAFWDLVPCWIIALMMNAVRTCEWSVNFYQATRPSTSEVSHFHVRRENLKSHLSWNSFLLITIQEKLQFVTLVQFDYLLGDRPDDGGSKHIWSVGKLLPDYTAQHPRRQSSSYSPPWEPEISPTLVVSIISSDMENILSLWCKRRRKSRRQYWVHHVNAEFAARFMHIVKELNVDEEKCRSFYRMGQSYFKTASVLLS